MFKPGTRVVKVAHPPFPVPNYRAIPIGSLATVVDQQPSESARELGADMRVMEDGERIAANTHSWRWRPLDTNDTTGITTTSALLRSLQGRVEA